MYIEFPLYGLTANHGSAQAIMADNRLVLPIFTTKEKADICRIPLGCFGPLLVFDTPKQLLMYLYAIPLIMNDYLFNGIAVDYSGIPSNTLVGNIEEWKIAVSRLLDKEDADLIVKIGSSITSSRIYTSMKRG